MDVIEKAINILRFEEGYREFPYYCSERYPTIGIGQRIGPKDADLSWYQFSVSEEAAMSWCKDRVKNIDKNLMKYPFYRVQDDNRKAVLISMAYQLGIVGLLKFKKMVAALEVMAYDTASNEALDSRWAKQTPERAKRHSDSIRTGII